MFKPLEGVKVIDLTYFVAGPGAARILADWGADVIKVEPSFGDPGRGTGATMSCPTNKDCNPFYTAYNANKRGLSLNLKSEDGKAILDKMLETADVFVSSYRTGALKRLGLDYVDLMLFHQPYGDYVSGWRAMEEAVRAGKVRAIGLSNFPLHKVDQILEVATIKPSVFQVEINPYWNQHKYKAALAARGLEGVVFEGWYPLGHGDKALLAEPLFAGLAEKYHKTPAQIVLRWHLQEGNVVFPTTRSVEHMRENLDVFDFALTADEMTRVNALPQRPYYVVPEDAPDFVLAHNDYSNQA